MTLATTSPQFALINPRHSRCQTSLAVQMGVEEALRLTGYGEFRGVAVDCDGGVVTISGRVPSFYLKQVAQNIALTTSGVRQVMNEVRVC